MSRLTAMAKEKAHRRTISVTTYEAGPGKSVVEGRLTDRRFVENYLLTGQKMPAGDIHDMIVRLLVDTASLTIEDVEVELVSVPRPECCELRESLSVIRGLRVTRGFTRKVKSLLAGTAGCSHLRELVEAMGPAVIQGVFSIRAADWDALRALMDDPHTRKAFSSTLVNSCYVWRQDGPEFRKVFDDKN